MSTTAPPGERVTLVVALAVFVLSALPVDQHAISGAERNVFRWLNQAPEIPYPLVWVFLQAGNFAAPFVAGAVAAIARRWRLAVLLPAVGVSTWLAAKAIKLVAGRGRPADVLADAITRHAPDSGLGWVSGHAAVAATVVALSWSALSPRWRAAAVSALLPLSIAKVYSGEHLPLDMVGGTAVGVLAGVLAARLARARWGAQWHTPARRAGFPRRGLSLHRRDQCSQR